MCFAQHHVDVVYVNSGVCVLRAAFDSCLSEKHNIRHSSLNMNHRCVKRSETEWETLHSQSPDSGN